jgi:pimeloyl-ACP methyl ester carboxylesterase
MIRFDLRPPLSDERFMWRLRVNVFLAGLALAMAGCRSVTPGSLDRVQPHSDKPLAGNVYLLRGLIGIWSHGIDELSDTISAEGIRASVYRQSQASRLAEAIIARYGGEGPHEPLVLIGHSLGADEALRIARRLAEHEIPVDLVVTLDPVYPPRVPGNVRLVYNIYQSGLLDRLPLFRGVALSVADPGQQNLQNVNIRVDRRDLLEASTDHFSIEQNPRIHAEVIRKLHEFCPPRETWLAEAARIRYASPVGSAPADPGGPGNGRNRLDAGLDRVP